MTLALQQALTEPAVPVELYKTLHHSDKVYSVAFSPDGRYLLAGSVTRHLHLWDLNKTEPTSTTLSGHTKFVWSASFSSDGKTIASASGDGSVFLWDVASASYYRIMESHPSLVLSLYGSVFSPDGRYLAAACMDGGIRLWSTWNRHPARRLLGHKGAVYGVAFSFDSRFLASGGEDETVRIWDVGKRREINVLARPGSRITHIVFSSDGRWLAYASADKNIYLSDLENGNINILKGHTGLVWNLSFSPDSRFLISASEDKTARIWEVERGLTLNVLQAHQGAVNSVAFSADGSFAASAGDDKTVNIWDLKYLNEHLDAGSGLYKERGERAKAEACEDYISTARRSVLEHLADVEELLPESSLKLFRQLLDLQPNLKLGQNGGGHTYTVGGYHGLSNKGELESLLPGEYLYTETLFLHRLCNREALYYGREGGLRKKRRLVYILTQTGLEMSGCCDLYARCLSLVLAEKLCSSPVELRQSFIGGDLSEPIDPAGRAGARTLLAFKDSRPLAWLDVLAKVGARIKDWRNEFSEIETIWIVDAFAVSDWESESRACIRKLLSVGPQRAWFVNPSEDGLPISCKSHSLFSRCDYLSDFLPQSFTAEVDRGGQL